MLAVSNTSPISNLASIGRLNLLQLQFGVIYIPDAVAIELSAHPDPVAHAAIQDAIHSGWLQTRSATNSALLTVLLSQLHAGESEAIALAVECSADRVLIDEKEGRNLAALSGLSVTGALGILLRAKVTGHIPAIQPEIEALRDRARFFLRPALVAKILAEAGEAKK
jgi:predicted nucleic acid-binding protein